MKSEPNYDVFVSYNSVDKTWVGLLVRRLKRLRIDGEALSIFYDEVSISAGESIPGVIRRSLERSRHVLLIMTPDWVKSEWCTLESEVAEWIDPANRRGKLIPLLLRDCKPPASIARLRHIDFRNAADCTKAFNGLLLSLRAHRSDAVLALIGDSQRREILNTPLLPWIASSPSYSLLWPELFVDPRVRPLKTGATVSRLSDVVESHNWSNCVGIVGSPGIGKSTALKKLYLDLQDQRQKRNILPILCTAKEYAVHGIGGIESLLVYQLKKSGYSKASFSTDGYQVVLLIDAFDEATLSERDTVLTLFRALDRNRISVWLSSRLDAFDRLVTHSGFSQFFDEVFELCDWDVQRDALPFISKVAAHLRIPKLLSTVRATLQSSSTLNPIVTNPFRLSLLLYIAKDGDLDPFSAFDNPYNLYLGFYRHWLERERTRGTTTQDGLTIFAAHRALARSLYGQRGDHYPLTARCLRVRSPKFASLLSDTAFLGLLRFDTRGGQMVFVRGFAHQTLLEYLVAEDVLIAFRIGGNGLAHSLSSAYRYEVNEFVRGAFSGMSSGERELLVENLSAEYDRLSKPFTSPRRRASRLSRAKLVPAERVREQLLYYLGRIETAACPSVIERAWKSEPSVLLRRCAAISALLHKNERIEREFMHFLRPASDWDLDNRSVQLAYFGDVNSDLDTYRDDGGVGWDRTRRAIFARLKLTGERELRLRLWDLRTLRLFFLSRRKRSPITLSIQERIVLRGVPKVTASCSGWKAREIKKEVAKCLAL